MTSSKIIAGGYPGPLGILSYAIRPFCPTSADGLQTGLL